MILLLLLTFKDGVCDHYCRTRRDAESGKHVKGYCECVIKDPYKDAVEKPFTLRFSREVDQEEGEEL